MAAWGDTDAVRPTALIVDDHPTFRRMAHRLLGAAGYQVVGEASDAQSAVAAVRRMRPQFVLLDVLLPGRRRDRGGRSNRRPRRPRRGADFESVGGRTRPRTARPLLHHQIGFDGRPVAGPGRRWLTPRSNRCRHVGPGSRSGYDGPCGRCCSSPAWRRRACCGATASRRSTSSTTWLSVSPRCSSACSSGRPSRATVSGRCWSRTRPGS